jgi:uncharacterized protein
MGSRGYSRSYKDLIIVLPTLTKNETLEIISGPAGKLEIAFSLPDGVAPREWGIVCHPHSQQGGTMYNKVVTTLVKAFQNLGLATVRFNFRGVGASEGEFDEGHGELKDLIAVMDWVQRESRVQEIWLAGFSFGAFVAAKAASQLAVNRLVTVAPAVTHFPMQLLPPIKCPWILVQGDQDEVVPAQQVYAWAMVCEPRPVVISFPTAGHFFHGQLTELRVRVEEALDF